VKTSSAKPHEIERKWFVIDAQGQTLGRLATRVATVLRGKHKPIYTPHIDCGDYVIGYPGGLKQVTLRRQLQTHPERVIEAAVRGMLPKNRLGRKMFRKLKVYDGPDHPHQAQQPEPLDL
jgi:large subunit ribosomal protein L13